MDTINNVFARIRNFLTVDFLAKKTAEGDEMGPDFAGKLYAYVSTLTDSVLQNVAKATRAKDDEELAGMFLQVLTHPRTGKTANLYAVDKVCKLSCALTPGGFDLFKIDSHTAAILANMSRFGFTMTNDEMKGVDAYHSKDCPKEWKAKAQGKMRVSQGYGKTTAGTQVSSTGMALHALGLAHYTGDTLTVRESDKVVRKIIAQFDKMSDEELRTVLHHTARAAMSPLNSVIETK